MKPLETGPFHLTYYEIHPYHGAFQMFSLRAKWYPVVGMLESHLAIFDSLNWLLK